MITAAQTIHIYFFFTIHILRFWMQFLFQFWVSRGRCLHPVLWHPLMTAEFACCWPRCACCAHACGGFTVHGVGTAVRTYYGELCVSVSVFSTQQMLIKSYIWVFAGVACWVVMDGDREGCQCPRTGPLSQSLTPPPTERERLVDVL